LLAVFLIVTAVGAGAIVVTSGVLWSGTAAEGVPPVEAPRAAAEPGSSPVRVVESLQLSQPRDPFRPLVTEDSPISGIPGVGGAPGSSDDGFAPSGTTITLQQIRTVGGTLRATITVNGTSYDVGVGDTFAGSYKVVSLTETKGVFMFGDSAFELSVGQQILK
jgi:hypothetical protein